MSNPTSSSPPAIRIGTGGEPHQIAGPGQPVLTTNHGMMISDDHNSLRAGPRVTDGAAAGAISSLLKAARGAGANVKIICPTIGGVALDDGTRLKADHQLGGGPSVLFDAVAIIASEAGTAALLGDAAAVAWVHDAFAHLKVIGVTQAAMPLLDHRRPDADRHPALCRDHPGAPRRTPAPRNAPCRPSSCAPKPPAPTRRMPPRPCVQ